MKNLPPTTSIPVSQLQEFHQRINSLSTDTEKLNGNLERLGAEYIQNQNFLQLITRTFPTLRKSIDDQNVFVNSIEPNQKTFDEDILFVRQKLNEITLVSNDGIYIWPINNVQEKMRK
jgi:uncharacterized coiled-coil DUF342 family protein